MKAEEKHWNICNGTERKQKDKHCKGEAVWRKQGGRKRVGEGKKRWRRCRKRRCNTDTFTHRQFYRRFLHTNVFTHIRFYTQTRLHPNVFTHRGIYTQRHLHTDAFTHTVDRVNKLLYKIDLCFAGIVLALMFPKKSSWWSRVVTCTCRHLETCSSLMTRAWNFTFFCRYTVRRLQPLSKKSLASLASVVMSCTGPCLFTLQLQPSF